MFNNQEQITLGGTGGTARTLNRIREQGGESSYLHRTDVDEIEMTIRHSKVAPKQPTRRIKSDANYMAPERSDRHNLVIKRTIFATATTPEYYSSCSITFVHPRGEPLANSSDLCLAATLFMSASNITKLQNLEV